MKYENIVYGTFEDRPNRFIAHVWVGDVLETVHVKNTGRCRELLLPGAKVVLQDRWTDGHPNNRKTRYDLISVYKETLGWVNIDSQVPNKVVGEWLATQGYDYIKPEYTYGNSRVDFYMEKNGEKYLLEVKGCTLEVDGEGYFPDAPSERAAKHCLELKGATEQGYHCLIAFVIAMPVVTEVHANVERDPKFAEALQKAVEAGVEVLHLPCEVTPDGITILEKVTK